MLKDDLNAERSEEQELNAADHQSASKSPGDRPVLPSCQRCTSTDRYYQVRLMEAKAQAPVKRMQGLETEIQQLEARWAGLGMRIEVALEKVADFRSLNHDLLFAMDKNMALRQ